MTTVRGYNSERLVSIERFPLRISWAHQYCPIGKTNDCDGFKGHVAQIVQRESYKIVSMCITVAKSL